MDAMTGKIINTDAYDLDAPEPVAAVSVRRPLDVDSSLEAHIGSLAISPDGQRVAVANGYRIMIFERESGKRLEILTGHLAVPQCVVFDYDSKGLFTTGGVDGRVKHWDLSHPLADRTLEPILKDAAPDPVLLEALLAGFAGREAEFLSARLTLPSWANAEPWRQTLLTRCASLLWRQRQPLAILRFLHLVCGQAEEQAWQQIALLEGLTAPPVRPPEGGRGRGMATLPRVVTLPTVINDECDSQSEGSSQNGFLKKL